MRWWSRFVLTVVAGPALWWIVEGYLATHRGTTIAQWGAAVPKVLPEVYLIYTVPALLLCAILYGLDRLLKLASLDLLGVLLSPVIAWALAWAAVRFVPESHVQAAGSSLPLFACYGLVWALTLREPRRRRSEGRSDGEFVDALLPRDRPPATSPDRATDAI